MSCFDLSQFIHEIPAVWKNIYTLLEQQGYSIIVTGGMVRDYLLFGHISSDWDVELRHSHHIFNKDDWKDLGKRMSSFGKVTFLPYEIIRLETDQFQFEFSPPRIEKFQDNWKELGHSNFEASFDYQLPFEKTIVRRDFTINAIGIRFLSINRAELLDPLNGLSHLTSRELHGCGGDFEKDPVRFLRAIRFSLKLDFKISNELLKVLEMMPIHGGNHSYLWNELQKSQHPIEMYYQLLKWSDKKTDLEIPRYGLPLLEQFDSFKLFVLDPSKHESWVVALEWMGFSSLEWQIFFKLAPEFVNRLSRWVKSTKTFIDLRPEAFHGDFSDVVAKPEFEILFDWYYTTKQIVQKDPTSTVLSLIESHVTGWIYLYRFEVLKDVKHIDPPLRAKYQLWNLCQKL